jgi:hypothetical protein
MSRHPKGPVMPDKPTPEQIHAFVLEDWFDVTKSAPGVWQDFTRLLKEHGYGFWGRVDEDAEQAWYDELEALGEHSSNPWEDR